LRYLILGPLEVRDGETEVALRGGQQRKLLAILLLHSGEAVSSDRLIEELWDGKPPETAAKALQGYVSSLRKQLGPEAVETVGAGYRLEVAPADTDAGHFGALLAEARPLERAPALAKLREALALWRGPALADFAYDDFARNEIDRLDELRLGAIERRIDLELALGHHDDLVPELESLVHAYPLRERLRGHLMVALYRSGRQADALDAYQDARTALRDELGLEPSEELQALQRAILDHDAELAAPPRVDVPVPAGAGRPPRSRKLRRPLLAVVLGLAILGGVAVALALTLGANNAEAVAVAPNSAVMIDQGTTRVEGVDRRPTAVAVGLGGVWVTNSVSGTVTKLDPATGDFVATIGVGTGDLNDVAVGLGSVWVADGNDGTVTQIDPTLDQVSHTYPEAAQSTIAANPVFYVAVGSGHVWATRGNELLRIDPKSGRVRVWAKVGTPTGLATGGGYVWVTSQTQNLLLRVNAETPNTFTPQAQPSTPIAPVFVRGSLWLIEGSELQQIHPLDLAAGDSFRVKGGPSALAAGNGALWATTYGGSLKRVVGSGGVTTLLHVSKKLGLSAVAVGRGATWVTVTATG
jgi:DNA-binding SARP family transcriptional activator